MFETFRENFGVFEKLKGKGVIDEKSLNEALKEIRVALLEASFNRNKKIYRKDKIKALVKKL